MKARQLFRRSVALLGVFLWISAITPTQVGAQPFGKGKFGANVPYGSQTSLTISTSGNVLIQVTPTDAGTLGTANGTVTVASTDVVGYDLYISSLTTTDMANGAFTLPASANVVAGALAVNTWGYNTDGTANFVGITTSEVLLHTLVGPATAGDVTTVTYGVKVNNAKPAGNYVTSVVYTAAAQTD